MRLDPIMIIVCDNPDCLGLVSDSKEIIREQVAITCGWMRGSIDSYVDQILQKNGWNVLKDEDFCPKCFGKEKENGTTNEAGSTSETPTEDSSAS